MSDHQTDVTSGANAVVHLALARGRAVTRALVWGTPAILLLASAAIVYPKLHWTSTGTTTALVDWCIGLAALPLPIAGLVCAIAALRWLLTACWPAPLGVFADAEFLDFRLGFFGRRTFDAARLDVKYLFELSTDGEEEGYEAFLPEEEQVARLLPRITHPGSRERLNALILKFTDGDESAAVATLRPVIEAWRANVPKTVE